jgi:hypothetical protein
MRAVAVLLMFVAACGTNTNPPGIVNASSSSELMIATRMPFDGFDIARPSEQRTDVSVVFR